MKTAKQTWIRLCLVVVVAVSAVGCAPSRKLFRPLCLEPAPGVEQLVAPLRERKKRVETLWVRAHVVIRQRFRPGVQHFDATLLAEVPDRLRFRAYRNATFLVFDILADGEGLRLHDAMGKRYYAADYEQLRRSRLPWAGLRPSLVLEGLLVEQSVVDKLAGAQSATTHRRWRSLELRIAGADGRVRVKFDRTGEKIVELTYEPATGEKSSRLRYGPMFEVEGVRLPRWVEITYGPSRTRMRLEILDDSDSAPKINRRFQPKVFQLRPPRGQSWLPLEQLR